MRRLIAIAATAAAAWGLAVIPADSRPSAVARRSVVIGHSVDGRRLIARVIGSDSAPRKVLLVGCIHGDECAGQLRRDGIAGGVNGQRRDRADFGDAHDVGNLDGDAERDEQQWHRDRTTDVNDQWRHRVPSFSHHSDFH